MSESLGSIRNRLILVPSTHLIPIFQTRRIEYDNKINQEMVHFNLIRFPPRPRRRPRSPLCSGEMPGISSLHHPSFPIRARGREVCGGRTGLPRSSFPRRPRERRQGQERRGYAFPRGKLTDIPQPHNWSVCAAQVSV